MYCESKLSSSLRFLEICLKNKFVTPLGSAMGMTFRQKYYIKKLRFLAIIRQERS